MPTDITPLRDDTLALEFQCRDCGVSVVCYGAGKNARERRCLICGFIATLAPDRREGFRRQVEALWVRLLPEGGNG